MNKEVLLHKLILYAQLLPDGDRDKLDKLLRRAQMIIRNVFGNDSNYLDDIETIYFSPSNFIANESDTWIKGITQLRNLFETMVEEFELFGSLQNKDDNTLLITRDIFIVHGKDDGMKQSVARTLEKLSFNPIILHEQLNKGKTIIEKFSEYSNVSFAIVLISPDDLAYPKDANPESAKYRARQNVIFELGYFIGKLGRDKVIALHKKSESFEIPSDYQGVLFISYSDDNDSWKYEVIKEMRHVGYNVDANILLS